MNVQTYIDTKLNDVVGKTFVITGANSGIGFEMVKILLEKSAYVVLACRNKDKAFNAIKSLEQKYQEKCSFIHLDQSDFVSIDNFIDELLASYGDFDSLILNAGILKPKKETYTKQGFRNVVGTNYLGVMYLVEKLKQKDNKGNRKIIFQSSLMARIGKYRDDDLINTSSTKFHAYNISKMGIDLYFLDCFKNDKKNKYYLAEPGACYSNIYSNFPKFILPIGNLFMKTFFHSAKKGALSALSLACYEYDNGTILAPRGIYRLSGFPKKIKLAKKLKKSRNVLRDGKLIINKYL